LSENDRGKNREKEKSLEVGETRNEEVTQLKFDWLIKRKKAGFAGSERVKPLN